MVKMGLRSLIRKFIHHRRFKSVIAGFRRSISIHYSGPPTLLDSLSLTYGTDKGGGQPAGVRFPWPSHTYTDIYSLLFSRSRLSTKLVFEFGIGSNNESIPNAMTKDGLPGASLRMWKEFFPNAKVFGADIDKDILFYEDRIRTFYCNQLVQRTISEMWNTIDVTGFDVIIDDGYHTFAAGVTTFESSIERLANDGVYIIEDVSEHDLIKFFDYFVEKTAYSVMYVRLKDSVLEPVDNNLVIITHL